MGYPSLEIDLSKIRLNTEYLVNLCSKHTIEIMGVAKGVCASLPIVKAMLSGGIKKLGDSRIQNIRALKEAGINVPMYLIRIPMPSELEEVINWSDGSLNSEIEVIKAISHKARLNDKLHKVILMVDVGDLREGIMPDDVLDVAGQILACPGVELEGLGTNVGCYGGIIPSMENTQILIDLARDIEKRYGITMKTLSGGNTATFNILEKNNLPQGINQFRTGEAILLGTDVTNNRVIPGTYQNTMILKTEVIEIKVKPSYPMGEMGLDAFGNIPIIVDKGLMKRAIVALGRQDCKIDGLTPIDPTIQIIGASSDHLLLDVTNSAGVALGSIIEFKLSYGAMLSLSTSSYVEKTFRS